MPLIIHTTTQCFRPLIYRLLNYNLKPQGYNEELSTIKDIASNNSYTHTNILPYKI